MISLREIKSDIAPETDALDGDYSEAELRVVSALVIHATSDAILSQTEGTRDDGPGYYENAVYAIDPARIIEELPVNTSDKRVFDLCERIISAVSYLNLLPQEQESA
jgi:hypothetical protein